MTASLSQIAGIFFKLGVTAFGGPVVHIAMMEEEVVRRRKWLTHEAFWDLLGATNLIPGPNSTELAIHIGYSQAGWPGLIVAGICFILPAFLIVSFLAWLYVTYGKLPELKGILYGVKPVVIAIVLQALWELGKKALKSKLLIFLALISAFAAFMGVNELAIIAGAGAFMAFKKFASGEQLQKKFKTIFLLPTTVLANTIPVSTVSTVSFGLWPMFLFFLKVGAILFGSGYVLLAFLRADLVERWGWLTQAQLLDAVAVGQITPGPVFTTATFIGYLLGDFPGAAIATIGIFLPSFFFVAISGPLIPKLRQSLLAGAVLDGVNVASWALMLVVSFQLGGTAFVDGWTITLGILSAGILYFTQFNSIWLVLVGGGIGVLLTASY